MLRHFLCLIILCIATFAPAMLTAGDTPPALAVGGGASVILADPIFQGLAIALMFGEITSLLISRMAVPLLYYWLHTRRGPDDRWAGLDAQKTADALRPIGATAMARLRATGQMCVDKSTKLCTVPQPFRPTPGHALPGPPSGPLDALYVGQ